jgi:hypothetical protein
MAKIHQFDDAAASRAIIKAQGRLDADFASRADLMGLVQQMCWRLPHFARPRRRMEVVRALKYIESLALTSENLAAVLVCLRVLEERFQSEAA